MKILKILRLAVVLEEFVFIAREQVTLLSQVDHQALQLVLNVEQVWLEDQVSMVLSMDVVAIRIARARKSNASFSA